MFFKGGLFVSTTLIFFNDFYFTAACVWAAASPGCPCSVHRFCYGHVYGVFVMDMLLRMLPHSPWLLATDASMFLPDIGDGAMSLVALPCHCDGRAFDTRVDGVAGMCLPTSRIGSRDFA